MYTITRTGSIADIIAAARDVPARVVPYAASAALTRVAKLGQQALQREMPAVFDRPIAYTLNSIRTVPSTTQTLAARVAVKDAAKNNGTLPENYLFPEVFGGPRKEKRFERAMRYAGLLQGRERAVLGQEAPLDAAGNLKRGEMQRILTATRSAFDPYQNKTGSAKSKKNAKNAPYFAARLGRTWGIWRRDGADPRPVLIFVTKQPTYRKRLDFEGIVERTARAEFEREFLRSANAIRARRGD